MKRSDIVLVGLIGLGTPALLWFGNSLGAADISPIVPVANPAAIHSEVEEPLVRPVRSPVGSEPNLPSASRAVTFKTGGLSKSSAIPMPVALAPSSELEPAVTDGFARTFHANGRLESEGQYRAGERDGYWVYYSESGSKELSGTYVSGKSEGTWTAWHANGRIRAVGSCRDGKFEGLCSFWSADGVLDSERSGVYQQGELIQRR